MRNHLIAGRAAGLVLSAPLSAQAAVSEQEVARLKQQVPVLPASGGFEAPNTRLAASGAVTNPARVEQLKPRVAEVRRPDDAQDRTRSPRVSPRTRAWTGRPS